MEYTAFVLLSIYISSFSTLLSNNTCTWVFHYLPSLQNQRFRIQFNFRRTPHQNITGGIHYYPTRCSHGSALIIESNNGQFLILVIHTYIDDPSPPASIASSKSFGFRWHRVPTDLYQNL